MILPRVKSVSLWLIFAWELVYLNNLRKSSWTRYRIGKILWIWKLGLGEDPGTQFFWKLKAVNFYTWDFFPGPTPSWGCFIFGNCHKCDLLRIHHVRKSTEATPRSLLAQWSCTHQKGWESDLNSQPVEYGELGKSQMNNLLSSLGNPSPSAVGIHKLQILSIRSGCSARCHVAWAGGRF